MVERHAMQCTLRSRTEPELPCAAVTMPHRALSSRIGGGSMCSRRPAAVVVVALATLGWAPLAHAQLLLSTNDNKVTLVNGVQPW
jgi:hypothetical protein